MTREELTAWCQEPCPGHPDDGMPSSEGLQNAGCFLCLCALLASEREAGAREALAACRAVLDWMEADVDGVTDSLMGEAAMEKVRAALGVAEKSPEGRRKVAALACLAQRLGYRVGRASQQGDWEDDWRGIVLMDLPTGQASWHFHDSELPLFQHLPFYPGQWDGHTTPEKYERLRALASGSGEQELAPPSGDGPRLASAGEVPRTHSPESPGTTTPPPRGVQEGGISSDMCECGHSELIHKGWTPGCRVGTCWCGRFRPSQGRRSPEGRGPQHPTHPRPNISWRETPGIVAPWFGLCACGASWSHCAPGERQCIERAHAEYCHASQGERG